MLRGVFLQNFVGFQKKQTITFKQTDSPKIFLGENGSGKSALLEGIRRCLISSRSTTRSSVYNEQESSYFVCKYDTSTCSELELKHDKDKPENTFLFTGIIAEPDQTYYKFVSTPAELLIDRHKAHNTIHLKGSDKDLFDELNDKNSLNLERFCNNVQTFLETKTGASCVNYVEERLQLLDKYVVMTLPLRSIGPLQWSKSERIAEEKRKENYSEASQRAEIISYFLENQNEFDLEKEKWYFSGLTERVDIQFELSAPKSEQVKSIIVKSTENKLPGDEFALLKMPEGILEAKYFSILMSSNHFLTLILEEPDRGMHPQMIEKMLAIIQSENRNKMVVLTTHNACFVSPLTISRLVVFKRLSSRTGNITNKGRTEIIPDLSLIFKEDKDTPQQNLSSQPGMKTLRLLTRDHFNDLIFAKRILFCEGESDFLFLTAVKEHIMKRSSGSYRVLKLINEEGAAGDITIEALQKIQVSTQIICMNGWKNAAKMHRVCGRQGLKVDDHYFVCDKDAMIDKDGKMISKNRWLDNYENIVEEFNSSRKDWKEARQELRNECKCFVWRDGTIEDMVMSLLRTETSRSETSSEGEVEVGWKEKKQVIDELKNEFVTLPLNRWQEKRMKENEAEKLFLSQEVTQDNISKSVEILLNACEQESDDLVQFVEFLLQMNRA